MAATAELPTKSERSPSPVTAPPIPATPGPRASALQKLYSDAIAHVLKTCNYTNFASCFPTPAREVPGSTKMLHESFTDKLGDQLKTEFEAILRERNVVASLNELDSMVDEARRRMGRRIEEGGAVQEPVAPHTLPPQHLYLSHLAPQLTTYSQEVKSRQKDVQAENVELLSRVQEQRREIARRLGRLEAVVADLDESVAALNHDEIESLRTEARDVDEGMRMEI